MKAQNSRDSLSLSVCIIINFSSTLDELWELKAF